MEARGVGYIESTDQVIALIHLASQNVLKLRSDDKWMLDSQYSTKHGSSSSSNISSSNNNENNNNIDISLKLAK